MDTPSAPEVQPSDFQYTPWSITLADKQAFERYVTRKKVQSVLEFGSGISTAVFGALCSVDSLDNMPQYAAKTRELVKHLPNAVVHEWNGRDLTPLLRPRYDMVFIDGPWFDSGDHRKDREAAFLHATRLSDRIWVHDALRDGEMRLQLWYLAPIYTRRGTVFSDSNRVMFLWEA